MCFRADYVAQRYAKTLGVKREAAMTMWKHKERKGVGRLGERIVTEKGFQREEEGVFVF